MKYSILSCFMLATIVSFGCGSCIDVQQQQPDSLAQYKEFFETPEQAEQALVAHITKRTVRVVIQCIIYDTRTNEVYKKKYDAGGGTGAIVYSSKNYSLVQTAEHVVNRNDAKSGHYIRKCTGFKIIRKDVNNTITDTVEGKVKILAVDKKYDIAMIQVFYNFGVQSKIAKKTYLGQSVRVIGYPANRYVRGSHLSYERGYIATKNMGTTNVRYGTAGYFGNSGGSVWNQNGEIVGTITSLGGFRTLMGHYIPQQNHLYGPGIKTLRAYFIKHRLQHLLHR